jgi:hypothetical protein
LSQLQPLRQPNQSRRESVAEAENNGINVVTEASRDAIDISQLLLIF